MKKKGLAVLIALGKPMKKKKSKLSAYDKKLMKKGRQEDKIADVMEEYKEKKLRAGSKRGPKVKNRKQALAIALSEAGVKRKKKKCKYCAK